MSTKKLCSNFRLPKEYKCKYGSCTYKTIRLDNLNRHVKTHSNDRMICECGAALAPTSMNRHRLSASHKQFLERDMNENIDQQANDNVDQSEICVNINTTIKIKTLPNGQIAIQQDPIQIGNTDFYLVPSHLLNQTEQ